MVPSLLAAICLLPLMAAQAPRPLPIAEELEAIRRDYAGGPDIGGLVSLDGRIRRLLDEPWKRSRTSVDAANFRPAWSAIGIGVGHYSDSLEYSGKLLAEAHRKNPTSEFRRSTLFAAILGERPDHGLGEMPDIEAARQYLKEFPEGPFAGDVAIILGDFYSDLFKVIAELRQNRPRGYKYDCFRNYVESTGLDAQASRAQRLSVSYYGQALRKAPSGWAETVDVRHRLEAMQSGAPAIIDAAGWHFCAD